MPSPAGFYLRAISKLTLERFTMLETNPITLAIGDVVKLNPESKMCQRCNLGDPSAFDIEHVIANSTYFSGDVGYLVHDTAWYSREDLIFVRRADQDSLNILWSQESGDEDDFDEDDEDSDEDESPTEPVVKLGKRSY